MELIDFLKKNKDSRKIFGASELKIIEKQLLGINLTQSEKNRLSRDIRKKLGFIKEAARFEEEFALKKGNEIKKIAEESKEVILEEKSFPKIKRVILFGSSVENKRSFNSDIDIAVDFFNITLKDATLFRKKLLGKLRERVDIQVYNILPDKIKKEIDKGKILYKNG